MSILTRRVVLIAQTSKISASDLAAAAAALSVQVNRDLYPVWHVEGEVYDSHPQSEGSPPSDAWPIYIADDIGEPGALGVHLDKHRQPYALVQYTPDWTVTVSHELLEMLCDPWGNRLHTGVAPDGRPCRYLEEVCDPCERQTYLIDGIAVSDFVLPRYYDHRTKASGQYSHLGSLSAPGQVLPGGYVSWLDESHAWHQLFVGEDGSRHFVRAGEAAAEAISLREWIDNTARIVRAEFRPR